MTNTKTTLMKKAGTTAYIAYSYPAPHNDCEVNEILIVRNVKTEAQAHKAWEVWLKGSHESMAAAEVNFITFYLYKLLKSFVDRVHETDAKAKASGASIGV